MNSFSRFWMIGAGEGRKVNEGERERMNYDDARRLLPYAGAFLIALVLGIMSQCAMKHESLQTEIAVRCIDKGGTWVGGNCIGARP